MKRYLLGKLVMMWLLTLLSPRHAHAQAQPTAKGPGAYLTVGVGGSIFQADYGQFHLAGPTIWVDANVHRMVGIEAEARFLRYHQQNNVSQDTYLVGPRISFKPSHIVPYVKLPVGLGHMNFPYDYATGNYFVLAPGGGVEYWLGDGVRLRLIDAEYQIWPQFSFGTLRPYGATVGISFRVF